LFALTPVEPVAAQETLPLVRPGDHAMSCQALAAEINTLAAPAPEMAAAKPKKKSGFGILRALGSAAPLLGGVGGGMGGAIASTALGAIGNDRGGGEDQMKTAMVDAHRMAVDAMNGGSVAAQRKQRLSAIFEDKHC
jgi:hypothetical protein